MGDVIEVQPHAGKIVKNGATVAEFKLKSEVLFDEVRRRPHQPDHRPQPHRQGARVPGLPGVDRVPPARRRPRARPASRWRRRWSAAPAACRKARASARHLLRAEDDHRGLAGHHRPDDARRAEGPGLPGLSADLVMQSFCHTAAYPKPVDVKTHRELPAFISNRGGVALRPGDGVIHSWLNRLLLPTPSAPAATRTRASRSASPSRPAPAWWPSAPPPA